MFEKQQMSEISGFLGVGSLEVLGTFFILDGMTGFLEFIEIYAKTSAWAILVAIPLLVVSYVLGLISSLAIGEIFNVFFPSRLTPSLFSAVSRSNNSALLQKYHDAEHHTLLLHGCFAAFLLLGIGSLAEVRMMDPFGLVGYVGFVGGIVVAALCPILVFRIQKQTVIFAQAIVEISEV